MKVLLLYGLYLLVVLGVLIVILLKIHREGKAPEQTWQWKPGYYEDKRKTKWMWLYILSLMCITISWVLLITIEKMNKWAPYLLIVGVVAFLIFNERVHQTWITWRSVSLIVITVILLGIYFKFKKSSARDKFLILSPMYLLALVTTISQN